MTLLLVVGNGLSIDLCHHLGGELLSTWHPSKPTSWMIPGIPIPGMNILASPAFPHLREAVRNAKRNLAPTGDFELIHSIVRRAREASEQSPTDIELDRTHFRLFDQSKKYLAYAYTVFQEQLDKGDYQSWAWTSWLRTYRSQIAMAVSFNYDLVAERLIGHVGLVPARIGIPDERGLPVLKPHSSIDFGPAGVGKGVWIINSNWAQRRLAWDEMKADRAECNLVLPGHESDLLGHQLVVEGHSKLRQITPQVTHCVIIGMSYWEVDRPEIDLILDLLQPRSRLVIANPTPVPDLVNAGRRRGLLIREWPNGPEPL